MFPSVSSNFTLRALQADDNAGIRALYPTVGWHRNDLSAATGAPGAAGDPAGYMFDAQGTQHVVYRSGDGHIQELWWG
jgi:hypothetical protein